MTNPTRRIAKTAAFLLLLFCCSAAVQTCRAGILEYLGLMAKQVTDGSKSPATLDPDGIYVWGKGSLAVPAMYSAAVNSQIAGVILEDAPDHHVGVTPVEATECETAIFHILKYADIPQACGLIFPRRTILMGERLAGFQWTKALYERLGAADQFLEHEGSVKALLAQIKNSPSVEEQ